MKPAFLVTAANEPTRQGVVIGSRWSPGTQHRCDTVHGTFELMNPPLIGHHESALQRALLMPIPPRVQRRISAIQQLRRKA